MIVDVDRAAGELRKRAQTAAEGDRLRNEAAVLDVARHPNVVRLLGGSGDSLRLEFVDGERLSDLDGRSEQEVARAAIVAATTLADLHDIGVVHRALAPEHVLIDTCGQPVLCAFGHGATGHRLDGGDAGADVVAMARAFMAVAPRGSALHRVLAGALAPRRQPVTARQLARLLAAPPERARRHRTIPNPVIRVATAALATAVVAVTVMAVAAPLVGVHRGPPPAGRPGAAPCGAIDGGCMAVARPGGVIQTSAGRYRIGGARDLVVLGRWHCALALPALLRLATGEVWAWDAWADTTTRRPARLVTRVPGAVSLQVAASTPGCDLLRVQGGDGAVVVVHPGQPA